MNKKRSLKEDWMHELRHLYGAGILLFYYAKWPILIGWPILRFYLNYPDNWIIDALWIWSLVLVFKDFYIWFIRKESYCTSKSCRSDNGDKKENDGNSTEYESK